MKYFEPCWFSDSIGKSFDLFYAIITNSIYSNSLCNSVAPSISWSFYIPSNMINSSSIYPPPLKNIYIYRDQARYKMLNKAINIDILPLLCIIYYIIFFFTWMIQLIISGSNFHVTCFCVPLNTFFLFWHFWNTFIITTFLTINNCDKSCTEGSITINIPYYLISCAWKAWSPVF